ncbi:GroES chaperonin family [Dillenia turbinata]|uniref:Protein groES n=1 Tax=Dillenia turbinata TaxID=194707 RepID=A0AAN8VDM0_9MAGN
MAKRLIPSLNRILVEKIVPPSKTNTGILLPEKTTKLNSGTVVAVGPGARDRDGNLIPVSVKEGDTVLLPEYGGTEVKLGEKEYVSFIPSGIFCRNKTRALHDHLVVFTLHCFLLISWLCNLCSDFARYHLYRDDDILGTLHE